MKEIDEFLEFLIKNENDERISISKKMKYGYRYFYISFHIDEKPEEDKNLQSYGTNRAFSAYRISDSVEIVIDNRNSCVELLYEHGSENIIIEDTQLVEKWSQILEDYINKDISEKTKSVIENTLSSCYNKNLYREYQMKKILPDDESL